MGSEVSNDERAGRATSGQEGGLGLDPPGHDDALEGNKQPSGTREKRGERRE
jgi:hypothetical protein